MLNLYKKLCLLMLAGPISLLLLILLASRSDLVVLLTPYVVLINFFCLIPLSILGGAAGMIASIKLGWSSFSYGLGMLLAGITNLLLLAMLGAMIT